MTAPTVEEIRAWLVAQGFDDHGNGFWTCLEKNLICKINPPSISCWYHVVSSTHDYSAMRHHVIADLRIVDGKLMGGLW